jgi:hypothetical protein
MIVVLARESAMRRQTTPRKLAVRLARKIFIVRKASTKSGPQKQKVAIRISFYLLRSSNLLNNNDLYERASRPEQFPAKRAPLCRYECIKVREAIGGKRDDLPGGHERRAEQLPRQLFTNI